MSGEDTSRESGVWWGAWPLDMEQAHCWRIGPLELMARRWPNEWRLAWRYGVDPLEAVLETRYAELEEFPDTRDGGWEVMRFGFKESTKALSLSPRTADRPVVVRPELPFYLPGGEETYLYVSTAAWVEVRAGVGGPLLCEMPTYRPSDCWFGPNTREGEICYASRSVGRMRFEDVSQRPHRILSRITLRNLAEDPFLIERINIPVPILSLHRDGLNRLWTRSLVMERSADGRAASVNLEESQLPEGVLAEPLTQARSNGERHVFKRAMDRLFG